MRPRVRSARNVIYVEADRVDAAPSVGSGAINLAGPSTAIRDLRVAKRGNATALTLLGTSRLVDHQHSGAEGRHAAAGARPAERDVGAAGVTSIKQGPVERVRIGANPARR